MNNNERPESEIEVNFSKNGKKSNPNKKRLVGVVGSAALAAAIAFGGGAALGHIPTSFAQANPTQTTQATTPGTSTGNSAAPGAANFNHGDHQRGRGGIQGGISGTISAISGNSLTLTRGSVVVIQATVNSNTVYTKAGQTISLADLKVGQQVSVRTTTATDGTVSVSAVEVVLSHAGGTVSAVDANSLTLTRPDNSTVKVALSSSTGYLDLGKTISLSDIKSGMRLDVAGTSNADGSLNAEVVRVQHDRLNGSVTAINGNTLTIQVQGRNGRGPNMPAPGAPSGSTTPPANGSASTTQTTTTKTITVSGSTVYLEGGQSVQISEIAVGTNISAEGTLSSDGNSLTALQVNIDLPHYQGQVTSVNGNTIVLQDRDGTSRTIEVTGTTKYLNGQATAALSDIKTGANIGVEGKVDASGKMTATQVQLGQAGPGQGFGGPGQGFGGPDQGFGGPGGHGRGGH
ncbi:MAG TPA: DUF5666 domain-containing protein [Chloroflexia bacterium]|nr:DUF5666 domain-containing protein [Chloroflexia bacterium]